ncbi:LasR-specific antiactivator QslA [Stutzerimonas stutzeri]|nr:LasR-specific antiactivator QslA [Stutzerimonas stutzeri]
MSKGVMTYLPPHDGHPGMEIAWATDCRKAFNQGVKLAQTWLDNVRSGWLWAVMIAERDLLPCAIERRAFEVGFLSRIHQRMNPTKAAVSRPRPMPRVIASATERP